MKKKRRAAGMRRPRSLQVTQRDAILRPRLQALEAEQPCWGDRRIWAHVHCVAQVAGHKKRSLRLMRAPQLLVQPHPGRQARRPPMARKPRPSKPDAWWGIEMTQVLGEGFGWVDIVLVLAWSSQQDRWPRRRCAMYRTVPLAGGLG
jgi:putative transposase